MDFKYTKTPTDDGEWRVEALVNNSYEWLATVQTEALADRLIASLEGRPYDGADTWPYPPPKDETGLYRFTINLEVLTNDPELVNDELRDIAHAGYDGDASIRGEVTSFDEVGRRYMARRLQAQGSEPGFLLGEDGWKYELHPGDEVTVNNRTYRINEVVYLDDNTVWIRPDEGHDIEARIVELS